MSADEVQSNGSRMLLRAQLDRAAGESVEVSQSAIGSVNGATVTVQQSGLRQVTAEEAILTQTAAGIVRGERVALRESAAVVAAGREVSVENSRVVFLLAPSVRGQVHAAFTLPAAFALGFGFVSARALLRLLGRLRR